jgi:hypothetical protein
MIHIVLALMVFLNTPALAREDVKELSVRELDVERTKPVQSYPSLSPDVLDKIYNPKKETHRFAIATKKDMPFCLQAEEGPFPFYGPCTDAQLVTLKTDYFASLQFDKVDIQEATEAIRLEASKIKRSNPTKALQLLYTSGWKMGNPSSIQMFKDLLVDLRNGGSEYIAEDSNLITLLDSYPKTFADAIRKIKASRASVDYRNYRKSSSESFREESDDDSESEGYYSTGDERAVLMKSYEDGGMRHRRK